MKRADQRKFHYLYKITRFDGKFYIGIHSTDTLQDGYFGSGTYLWKSLNKHGKEKHIKEILEFFESRQLSKDREKQILTEEFRNDPQCMNIAPGGGGGFNDEHHQRKCSSAGGRVTGHTLGKKFGKINGPKNILIAKSKGTMKVPDWTGRKHSDNTKIKMSVSQQGKHNGNKNSQFGTKWITNGIISKKLSKEEIVPDGWFLGRHKISHLGQD